MYGRVALAMWLLFLNYFLFLHHVASSMTGLPYPCGCWLASCCIIYDGVNFINYLLTIDTAFYKGAKYIALLNLNLFKPLRLFSHIKRVALAMWLLSCIMLHHLTYPYLIWAYFIIKLFLFIKSVNLYFENGDKCFNIWAHFLIKLLLFIKKGEFVFWHW